MINNIKNTIDGLIYFVETQGKSIVGNVFGFNETISKLETEKNTLFDNFESLKIQMEIALENESSNKAKVEELQKLLDAGGKGMKERNYLPEVFEESSDVYKFGFWLKNSKGEKYLEPIDAGGHLTLTSFMYHIINKAKLTGKETALEAFNKILGAQQTYTTYTYDQDQWGASHGENWTPAIIVLNTKTDDCIAEYEEIYTKDGVCKIKDLTIGQEVLSYNFKKQEYEYKPIMNIWDKGKLNINKVHFRNGSRTIDVSEEHPFLVAKKGKTLFKKHETIAYEKVSLKNIDLENGINEKFQ